VALVGGPSVGKTTFLLMSIQSLINGIQGGKLMRAEIAAPRQKADIEQELAALKIGIPPVKTDRTLRHAYQLRLQQHSGESLLFYYDAAGEEFSSIERYGRHENVKHLDGLILLVDPFSLDGLRHEAARNDAALGASTTALDDVVAATIGTLHRMHRQKNQQNPIPLAVVITKADAEPVKNVLGDIRHRLPSDKRCKQALEDWGAGNSLRLLQQNFKTVRFFACSALGRVPQQGLNRPFQPYGILEPLLWVLQK